MGPLRAVTIQEQNPNRVAGVQVDTAVYGSAAPINIRVGREAPVYILAGTQTSSLTLVVLDLFNAAGGDQITVKKYTTSVLGTGAGQFQVLSGSSAGALVGAIQVGTATPVSVTAVFDGVNQVWR